MHADWKPLFDVREAGITDLLPLAAIGALLALVAIIWFVRAHGVAPAVLGGFALLWLAVTTAWPIWQRQHAGERLAENRVLRTEGPIRDYRAWRQQRPREALSDRRQYDRHERFSVGGTEFTFTTGRLAELLAKQGIAFDPDAPAPSLRIAWIDLQFAGGQERILATVDGAAAAPGAAPSARQDTAVTPGADPDTQALIEAIRREAEAANAAAAEDIRRAR